MRFSSVPEALAFIESFATRTPDIYDTLPPQLRQAARFPYMPRLLALLGNPQEGLRVAHITGTSGKGSTATILAAILRAADLHIGLYTNPSITRPQERIQIDGHCIADDELMACTMLVADAVERMMADYPQVHPNLKSMWVALALLACARAGVNYAVIEVGMGGRYDETNVVHPAVALITNIGRDHQEYLGETLSAIAYHKAGIIKEGAPSVTGVTQPEIDAFLKAEATLQGSSRAALGKDFRVLAHSTDEHGTRFDYRDGHGTLWQLQMAHIGTHQATNAALALQAARTLLPDLTEAAIRDGLEQAWLPGRFEIARRQPIVVLDAAHNVDKMRSLAHTLQQIFPQRQIWIVFGALNTKDLGGMLQELCVLHPHCIATMPAAAGKTATPAAQVAALATSLGLPSIVESHPHDALRYALTHASTDDIIVITGSLFLVSNLRPLVYEN